MKISLQVNHSPNNALNKTITTHAQWDGTIKEASSIIDPIILMQSSDLLSLINYVTIDEFKRSYFVKNIIAVNNNLVEVYCHVDVLSSFADEIKNNSAIIYRQENEWNLLLDDGSFKFSNAPEYVFKPFPNGFQLMEYVLTVAGGDWV